MSKFLQWITPRLSDMIQSGWRSSAMKPLLCADAILFLIVWIMPESVNFLDISVKGILGLMSCLMMLLTAIAFFILLFKDRKCLQSEHFQLSMRRMDLDAQRLGGPLSGIGIVGSLPALASSTNNANNEEKLVSEANKVQNVEEVEEAPIRDVP